MFFFLFCILAFCFRLLHVPRCWYLHRCWLCGVRFVLCSGCRCFFTCCLRFTVVSPSSPCLSLLCRPLCTSSFSLTRLRTHARTREPLFSSHLFFFLVTSQLCCQPCVRVCTRVISLHFVGRVSPYMTVRILVCDATCVFSFCSVSLWPLHCSLASPPTPPSPQVFLCFVSPIGVAMCMSLFT